MIDTNHHKEIVMNKPTDRKLNQLQTDALCVAKNHFGQYWKSELSVCWMNAAYPPSLKSVSHLLQQARNTIGPSGLDKLRLSGFAVGHQCDCGCMTDWVYAGLLGVDGHVVECSNCGHIEYADKVYLDENRVPLQIKG
jgi:hypothetical protein